MGTAQVSLFTLTSCVAAIWLALSGGVVEAGDLPPEAYRVFDEQGCWLLLGENKIPCAAAKVIAPAILRPDAELNGLQRCVERMRTASGRVFDVPPCEENCRRVNGPAVAKCTTIGLPRK
jgi:hypothetical protein